MAIARQALLAVKADTRQFQREMRAATDGIDKFVGQARTGIQVLGSVGIVAGAAAGAIAGVGVRAFGDYDQKLQQSLSIMGDVSEMQRGEMSDAARQVAVTTRQSAGEAAESYFFLASAGLDAEQSISALPVVARFAQAGMFDMATATDLATDAQSALGLTVADAAANQQNLIKVTDTLVKANTLANASTQQFSEALTNKAGASLRILNKDITEGVAVLSVYADQGLKGAAAGEALSIVLRDLQNAAINNTAEFRSLGVEVFDQAGNMNQIADIIGQVEAATDGMSDATRKATLTQLGFQERSVQQIVALLGASEQIRNYQTRLEDAAGVTEQVADRQMKTLNEQLGLLKDQAVDAAIGVGQNLTPEIEALIPSLSSAIDSAAEIAEDVGPALVTTLGHIADGFVAVGTVVDAISEGSTAVGRTNVVIHELNQGLGEGVDPATRYAAAIGTLTNRSNRAVGQMGLLAGLSPVVGGAFAILNRETDLTADNLQQVADTIGLTSDELAAGIDVTLRNAAALGLNAEETDALRQMRIELAQQIDDAAAIIAGDAAELEALTGQVQAAGEAHVEAVDGIEEHTEAAAGFADEIARARDEQESLAAAVKEFTDPVFAAAAALEQLQTAEQRVAELEAEGKTGTDEWAQAQLELAEQTLDTQAKLDSISPDSLESALATIGEALDLDRQATVDLLEQLNLLDGKKVTAVIDIQQIITTTGSNTGPTTPDFVEQVTSNVGVGGGGVQARASLPTNTRGDTNITVMSPTNDLQRDLQLALQLDQVTRNVETLVGL